MPASKVYDGTTTAVVSGTAALQAAESAGGQTSDGTPYRGHSEPDRHATGTYNSKMSLTATTVTVGRLVLTGRAMSDYTLRRQARRDDHAQGVDVQRPLGAGEQGLQRHDNGRGERHGSVADCKKRAEQHVDGTPYTVTP